MAAENVQKDVKKHIAMEGSKELKLEDFLFCDDFLTQNVRIHEKSWNYKKSDRENFAKSSNNPQ